MAVETEEKLLSQLTEGSVLMFDNATIHKGGGIAELNDGQGSTSSQTSEQRRYYVEPAEFATLKRGGVLNGLQVETILYNGAYRFTDRVTGEFLPDKRLTFNQG